MKNARRYTHPQISQGDALSRRLVELTLALDEKNRQLERSEAARKAMFSNITHDLRAPLAAIRGAAERLNGDGPDPEERQRMINIIIARTETLDQLVGDLYLSALVEQPEFALSPSPLEIAPLLEEYYISMKGAGRLDGRESALCVPDGFAAWAMIDPRYFLRVLDNLFSNALRHTETGDRIELGCRQTPDAVEIYVKDSGTGIPPDDLPRIFSRAFTGTAARTPGKTGGGLGLSISESIVRKHGGRIRCESVYGDGATFTVSLPAVQSG